jgi:hypothetical protein
LILNQKGFGGISKEIWVEFKEGFRIIHGEKEKGFSFMSYDLGGLREFKKRIEKDSKGLGVTQEEEGKGYLNSFLGKGRSGYPCMIWKTLRDSNGILRGLCYGFKMDSMRGFFCSGFVHSKRTQN